MSDKMYNMKKTSKSIIFNWSSEGACTVRMLGRSKRTNQTQLLISRSLSVHLLRTGKWILLCLGIRVGRKWTLWEARWDQQIAVRVLMDANGLSCPRPASPPLPIFQGSTSAQPRPLVPPRHAQGLRDILLTLREQPSLHPGNGILLVPARITLKNPQMGLCMEPLPFASPWVEVAPGPTRQEPFMGLRSPTGRAGVVGAGGTQD